MPFSSFLPSSLPPLLPLDVGLPNSWALNKVSASSLEHYVKRLSLGGCCSVSRPFRCRWVEDDIVDGLYQLQLNYAFDLVVNMLVKWLRLISSQVVYR